MDFVFGLPPDAAGNTGVVVFVDRLIKMAHLAAVLDTIDGEGTAALFLDRVFGQHSLPEAVVSDRDPRFTGKFWTSFYAVLGTRLDMSTADHPQTDGQTERVNRVVEDVLRSVCAETPKRWSAMLPLVEFALNNAVHASTGYTPCFVNVLSHPRVPLMPSRPGSGLSGRGRSSRSDLLPYLDPARVSFGDLGSRASPTHLEAAPSSQQEGPRGRSSDRGRAEPLAGEPVGQSDRGPQPALASSPHRDGQSPANTAPSAQERPPGHQDHGCDPTVREELGPSPDAGAANQYHLSSYRRAGQRLGRATAVDPGSVRAPPPRPTSGEDSAAARRPPPALLDEPGNRHFHVERILAKRRCRGHYQYLVNWRGYPHSENSWEFEVPLRQDCPGVVNAFDQIDQPEGSRPRRRSTRASQL
ncbi:unnamed protein product [Phytophthora fragariaefolia]|uniref:Unnamed protein product n=1 Tax=Phytophthora fragariaefolia TaxID=1490495 RepID=A0A9W6YK38_9STRA|nr:unnamed protein product [Phytophthora fragariaefolia]